MVDPSISFLDEGSPIMVVVPSGIVPVAGTSKPLSWVGYSVTFSIWEEVTASAPVATPVDDIQMKH